MSLATRTVHGMSAKELRYANQARARRTPEDKINMVILAGRMPTLSEKRCGEIMRSLSQPVDK